MPWPEMFTTSRVDPITYAIFRALSTSLFVGHQLDHWWSFREEGWLYLVYMTHWTMILGTISECLLLHLSWKGMALRARHVEMPMLARLELVLWHVVQPFSSIVMILFWTSWLLENPLEDLQQLNYIDFYAHGLGHVWLLLSFLISNVPFSFCTGFGSCVTYALIYMAWSLLHFFAKIGTARPCDVYPQNECPIYSLLDWHKPQLTIVIASLVCLVACPVACLFYATLAARCRRSQDVEDNESKTRYPREESKETSADMAGP